jgi:predicted MFS family arabinose efflux permease
MRSWYEVAIARGLVSLCVPFRVVAMNGAFLHRLSEFGPSKAGWYRGAQTTGVSLLGPLLGTFLIAHTSYEVAFVVLGLQFAVMAAYGRVFLPDMDDAGTAETTAPSRFFHELRELLRIVAIRESCIVELISSSLTALFTTFIIVLAVKVTHLPQEQAVSLVLVQGIASVVSLFLLGKTLSRLSARAAHYASFVASAAGIALFGIASSFVILILGTILISAGTALIHLARMNQLSRVAVSKSKLAGLYNLVGMAGALVGATLGGVIAEHFGLQVMFVVWIPVLLLTAVFCRRSI